MLSSYEIRQILEWISERADEMVIVGGQALAIWERLLQMRLRVQTRDIDILGMAEESASLAELIKGDLVIADPMDFSPNLAVISRGDDVLVDFLSAVKGVSETGILTRRVLVETTAGAVYLMHPLDCLTSKLANYFELPEKRTEAGLAQLESAILIVRRFIEEKLNAPDGEKEAIWLVNEIYDLAESQMGKQAWAFLDVHLENAVPAREHFSEPMFLQENLPRRCQSLEARRTRFCEFLAKRGHLEQSRIAYAPRGS